MKSPYKNSILSLKGIGEITAAGLIGEVGDFAKFKTISEITKLAGLDLFEVSSGKHKGQQHISKRGRPLMRKLLFLRLSMSCGKVESCMSNIRNISTGECPG